jgi:hypothetical protein
LAPDIPGEQLERLQPLVEALLADLRRHTRGLAPNMDMPLDYQLEPGIGS